MIIAHDLGTTGDKASLHDEGGAVVASATVEYPTSFAAGGVAEQDPQQWWSAVGAATRELLERTGTPPSAVAGVGLSGQMMGAVLLDEDAEPVGPALIWADHRATAQADALLRQVPQEEAYAELGHRIHPTYTLAKLMWVREHQPERWARVHRACLAKDLVAHRLTGVLATDPSDASGTDAFDQRSGTWSQRLLGAAGLDASLLPPVVASTTVLGGLTAAAAAHTGLVEGTPVVLGGGDGPMAAVGAGVVAPEDGVYACLGSSAWVAASSPQPLHDPAMRSMTFNHVVPGQFTPTATMQAGGASVAWVVDLLTAGQAGSARERTGTLLAAAAGVAAADEGLFFLPYLLGERSPHWNAAAAGSFVGLQRHHGPAHLVRAVLEGVGFNLLTCLDAFSENGLAVDGVDAIGGGAGSVVWTQVLADIWGVPVRRRTTDAEANSTGAAVTASVALGLAGWDVARSLSATVGEATPDAAVTARRREQHGVFQAAYGQLEPWFPTRTVAP